MSASILGPNGQRMVELGGERAWLTRTKGDIVCSFQWLHVDEVDREAPVACMCLFPAVRHMDTAAYVVPQTNAWAYASSDGGPTPALAGLAFKAATHMGFFPDESTIFRIMDIVLEGMPDLVRMPSEQPGTLDIKRLVHGIEARATVNGKTFNETLL